LNILITKLNKGIGLQEISFYHPLEWENWLLMGIERLMKVTSRIASFSLSPRWPSYPHFLCIWASISYSFSMMGSMSCKGSPSSDDKVISALSWIEVFLSPSLKAPFYRHSIHLMHLLTLLFQVKSKHIQLMVRQLPLHLKDACKMFLPWVRRWGLANPWLN